MRVARGHDHVRRQEQDRVRAAHLFERHHQRLDDVRAGVPRHQMQDYLGIARGLEDRALQLELVPDRPRVDQVAVVDDRHRAIEVLETIGWALVRILDPAVEYRVCPMAERPGRRASRRSEKMSATWPIPRSTWMRLPSVLTMPALSWPRCWRA